MFRSATRFFRACALSCLVSSSVLGAAPEDAAALRDALSRATADDEGLTGAEFRELSAQVHARLKEPSRDADPLALLRIMGDLAATHSPTLSAETWRESLAEIASGIESRSSDPEYSSAAIRYFRQVLSRFPYSDEADDRPRQIEVLNNRAFILRELHAGAETDWLRALALMNLAFNRLEMDRNFAGLDARERSELASLVASASELGDYTFGKYQFKEAMEISLLELVHMHVGALAPPISGQTLDGETIRLADLRGKVVLVSFWAKWCAPCIAVIPEEKELTESLRGKDFVLLGVNVDGSIAEAQQIVDRFGMDWPSIWNGPGKWIGPVTDAWAVRRFPSFVVLDVEGVIRYRNAGGGPTVLEDIRATIDELLAEME